MTEQDYINTTTLARCMTLNQVLRDMAPPEIVPCIDREDFCRMVRAVSEWQDRLFAAVHESRDKASGEGDESSCSCAEGESCIDCQEFDDD